MKSDVGTIFIRFRLLSLIFTVPDCCVITLLSIRMMPEDCEVGHVDEFVDLGPF